jgi:UDP-N-acetylmuramate--alanine ligase
LQPPESSLEGRRIWFAGIGGAGLSGYAVLASAWGAEVAGWDRAETPYLVYVRAAGIPVTVSPEPPAAPDGFEVVVSTAFAARVAGKSRAEFLSELVSLRAAIVVAGTHGKTTTCAMIAYALDRLGLDPAFLIGGEVPQLGGNARAGAGWLVVEGDESDRTVASLKPEIAVVTNVELDHHTTFASAAEVEELFERWLEGVPHIVRGHELDPADVDLAVPGELNRRNAACALAALELAGVARADAEQALSEFRGVRRRLEVRGELNGVRVVDDYGHHPSEVKAVVDALCEGPAAGRLLVLFQPHLYSRTRHFARELAASLASADAACVTDVYAAREEPVDGVSGKLIVDALAELRPGMPVGWAPELADGVRFLRNRARAGDTVLTQGAGDVDRAAALFLGEEP